MRMLWDLHKARQRKRNRMLQFKRVQKIRDFIDNMEVAQQFIDIWMDKNNIDVLDFDKDWNKLSSIYQDYVCSKYKHEKFNLPMVKEHMHMDDTWRLWMLACKISGQATQAREEARRLNKQFNAVYALMKHKMRKCMGA